MYGRTTVESPQLHIAPATNGTGTGDKVEQLTELKEILYIETIKKDIIV